MDRNLALGIGCALALHVGLAWGAVRLRPPPVRVAPPPLEHVAEAVAVDVELPHPRAPLPAEPLPVAQAGAQVAAVPQPSRSAVLVRPHRSVAKAAPPQPDPAPVASAAPPLAPGGATAPAEAVGTAGAPHHGAAPVAGSGETPGGGPASGAGDVDAGPLAAGAVDEPPRILHANAPLYPERAERRREETVVRLRAVVDATGLVTAVDVRCDACDSAFLDATRAAVRSWRFAPARLHGRAVAVRFAQDIEFALPDG